MAIDEKSSMQHSLGNNFRYDEVWEVYVSNQREPYLLDEIEFAILKEEILKGSKGTVAFETFGINLTYFVSYFRKSHSLKKEFQLSAPETEVYNPSPEQREVVSKKIAEMRNRLGVKLSMKGGNKKID